MEYIIGIAHSAVLILLLPILLLQGRELIQGRELTLIPIMRIYSCMAKELKVLKRA